MLVEGGTPLSTLQAAVRGFQAREERRVDLKSLRVVIDALECEFAAEARDAKKSGDHLIGGNVTAASWISRICGMSVPSAADRVCVGEQLESLPKVAAAVSSGEISYQSASVICHLRDKLGEKREHLTKSSGSALPARTRSRTCAGSPITSATRWIRTASSATPGRATKSASSTSAR